MANGLCVVCGTNHHSCQDHPFQETVFNSSQTKDELEKDTDLIEAAKRIMWCGFVSSAVRELRDYIQAREARIMLNSKQANSRDILEVIGDWVFDSRKNWPLNEDSDYSYRLACQSRLEAADEIEQILLEEARKKRS
jgi:hypothetical protein